MIDVMLLKAVETLGQEGQVVRVRPGYARNYLLPSGLAVPATASQLKAAAERQRQRERAAQRLAADASALKRKLEGRALTLTLTVGEDAQPFGSITAHDLAEALRQDGVPVEKSWIQLEQPLKTLGAFEVPVRLSGGLTAQLHVRVAKKP